MAASFFFYDLETSGFDPRSARIMQFAGQRTDVDLQPAGEPINQLIKLTPDVLPDPDAILVTGLTPQHTIAEGLTEAAFLQLFYEQVVQPDTIFVGFNSIRFDDEFMRFSHYRNFYDAYEWQWKNGCSRWDLLDVVRMTRALRPEGIKWPFAPDGKPANRLEFLTKINKLSHTAAHDALSDVLATIEMARLIQAKQPELFAYLLAVRSKQKVAVLLESGQPFVYTSGRYPSTNLHTTVAVRLVEHPQADTALVYDLRHDPTPFLAMNVEQLVEAWKFTKDPAALRLPVKTLKYNRCPALAPLGVLKRPTDQQRIGLDLDTVAKHLKLLTAHRVAFAERVLAALDQLDAARKQQQLAVVDDQFTVDSRLYDGFVGPADKATMQAVTAAPPEALADYGARFKDRRLQALLPLYKARNYPAALDSEERVAWDQFCHRRLFEGNPSRAQSYFNRLKELSSGTLTTKQQFLLEELQLYGESIVPAEAVG